MSDEEPYFSADLKYGVQVFSTFMLFRKAGMLIACYSEPYGNEGNRVYKNIPLEMTPSQLRELSEWTGKAADYLEKETQQ